MGQDLEGGADDPKDGEPKSSSYAAQVAIMEALFNTSCRATLIIKS